MFDSCFDLKIKHKFELIQTEIKINIIIIETYVILFKNRMSDLINSINECQSNYYKIQKFIVNINAFNNNYICSFDTSTFIIMLIVFINKYFDKI